MKKHLTDHGYSCTNGHALPLLQLSPEASCTHTCSKWAWMREARPPKPASSNSVNRYQCRVMAKVGLASARATRNLDRRDTLSRS
eukprot:903887-Pelagomonas_calceolata.AAC.1